MKEGVHPGDCMVYTVAWAEGGMLAHVQSSSPDITGSEQHSFHNIDLRNDVVLRLE